LAQNPIGHTRHLTSQSSGRRVRRNKDVDSGVNRTSRGPGRVKSEVDGNILPDGATNGCRNPRADELSKQEDTFRELLDRNYPRWLGIARCYAAPDAREDLMQEISMQVWKSLDHFAGRSRIDTWAYRIAINTALAWERSARSRKKRLGNDPVDVSKLGGGLADENAEKRILDEFLASLADVDRAAMLLYLDKVPADEAAEILGLTEGGLRVRMHRIRKRFEAAYCERVETQ
jgi:RNA polymerase sigma-70 factor, ECF subfamily